MRKLSVGLMIVAIAWGCGTRGEAPAGGGSASAGSAVIPKPVAASITPDQFAGLKWLEGYWRGAAPGGPPFYERYAFADDSSIAMYTFPDLTFAAASDSARVTLRGGVVRDAGSTASWVATRLDSASVDFAPEWGATNTFTWQKDGDDWTATIESGSGSSKSVAVYRMRRVRSHPQSAGSP